VNNQDAHLYVSPSSFRGQAAGRMSCGTSFPNAPRGQGVAPSLPIEEGAPKVRSWLPVDRHQVSFGALIAATHENLVDLSPDPIWRWIQGVYPQQIGTRSSIRVMHGGSFLPGPAALQAAFLGSFTLTLIDLEVPVPESSSAGEIARKRVVRLTLRSMPAEQD
jgi:hypothetical protein